MKCFIFSEMWGCYSYTVQIVAADSLSQAASRLSKDSPNYENNILIKVFSYDPFNDVKLDSITIPYTPGISWEESKLSHRKYTDKTYAQLYDIASDADKTIGISGERFLRTNAGGWYDWIECEMNVSKDYYFADGHDG